MSGLLFWMSGLIFWMSGLVFWMSGFVFRVSGLVFWMSGIVCLVSGLVFCMSGLVFWVYGPGADRRTGGRTDRRTYGRCTLSMVSYEIPAPVLGSRYPETKHQKICTAFIQIRNCATNPSKFIRMQQHSSS